MLEQWQVEVPVVDVATGAGEDVDRLAAGVRAPRRSTWAAILMLRTTLFRLAPDDHVVLFQTHHVAFDAWAVEIFYRELARGVRGVLEARSRTWPRSRCSTATSRSGSATCSTGDRLEQRDRVLARLPRRGADVSRRSRPTGRGRTPSIFEAGRHTIELPGSVADDLRALCAAEGVTPYMLLLAAFATLLYRETGQDDMLVGGPSANRGRAEFEGLIGFFANTLVTRVQLRGNPTFRELLARVRRTVLEAIEHQELPFERVVELVRPPRRPGVNPLFQVNFRTRVGPAADAGARRRDDGADSERASGWPGSTSRSRPTFATTASAGSSSTRPHCSTRVRVERLAAAFERCLPRTPSPIRLAPLLGFELPAELAWPAGRSADPRLPGTR